MTMMYQCHLQQGNTTTIGYIEERGAKKNAQVEIPELGGFWKVTQVGMGMNKKALQQKQVNDRDCFGSLQKV